MPDKGNGRGGNGRGGNGKFAKGNRCSPGRPLGSRHKLSEDFLRDFHTVWLAKGLGALQCMVEKMPAEFVRVAASLMPKEFAMEELVPTGKKRELYTPVHLKFMQELQEEVGGGYPNTQQVLAKLEEMPLTWHLPVDVAPNGNLEHEN